MNHQRTQAQPSCSLTCSKHQEPIKGVCLSKSKCNERLICRGCRRTHDNNHLNHYEELEDLTNGSLVNDLLKDFEGMIKRIDAHNLASIQSTQNLIGKVDSLFNKIQAHLMQKLNQSRTQIVEDISKKFKTDNTSKQKLITSMEDLHKSYKIASNNNFQAVYSLETLIQVISQAQTLKEIVSNDPNLNTQQNSELTADYLTDLTSGNLFQHVVTSFERICQYISDNFLVKGNKDESLCTIPAQKLENHSLFEQIGQETGKSFKQINQDLMNLENVQLNPQFNIFPDTNNQFTNSSLLQTSCLSKTPNRVHNTQNSGSNLPLETLKQSHYNDSIVNYGRSPFKQIQNLGQAQNIRCPPIVEIPEGFVSVGQDIDLPPFTDNKSLTQMSISKSLVNEIQAPLLNDFGGQIQSKNSGDKSSSSDVKRVQDQVNLNMIQNIVESGFAFSNLNNSTPTRGASAPIQSHTDNFQNVLNRSQLISKSNIQSSQPIPPETMFFEGSIVNLDISTLRQLGLSLNESEQLSISGNLYQEERATTREKSSHHSKNGENNLKQNDSLMQKRTPSHILEIFKKVEQEQSTSASSLGRTNDNPDLQIQLNQPLMNISQGSQGTIEIAVSDPFSSNMTTCFQTNDPRKMQTPQKGPKTVRTPDGEKKNLDLKYQEEIQTRHEQILFGGVIYLSSRHQLVTAGREGQIQVWDLSTCESICSFEAHKCEIFRLFYIEEKDLIASGAADGTIKIWDCRNQFKLINIFQKHEGPVYAKEYLSELEMMVSGGEDSQLIFWSIDGTKEISIIKTSDLKICSLCDLKRQKKLVIGFNKGYLNIINLNTQIKKLANPIKAHQSYVFNMFSIEEQGLLVTGGDDGLIKIWRIYGERLECISEFGQKGKMIRSFVVMIEKDLIITNHNDNYLRLWKTSTGENLQKFYNESFGESLILLGNKGKIVTGNHDKLKLWIVNC